MAVSPLHVVEGTSPARLTRRERAPAADEAAPRMDPRDVLGAPDEARFSAEALARTARAAEETPRADEPSLAAGAERRDAGRAALTEEQRREVDKLKARDAEVRMHEAAHMGAGGSHVRGGATYTYQQGPDGRSYAIGGEVGIDVSPVAGNPQATIQKMQQVRAAALAPAEPSGADRAVAGRAAQLEAQARTQLSEQAGRAVDSRSRGWGDSLTSVATARLEVTA